VQDVAVVVERARHPVDELAALGEEARRNVLGQATDLEVAGVHPLPGHELGQVEDRLPLAEAVPEHRDRAQLERRRAEVDEVRMDPVELAEQHPHPRRLRRHLEPEQLFDREHEHEPVVLIADVVDSLREGDALPVGLRLHRLLEAGVQVADHGRDADDLLAVEVDDQAEDAVRRGVVRAEVDLKDVLVREQLLGDLEHGRHAGRDARPLVLLVGDDRPPPTGCGRCDAHSSSVKRTGSPPIG
jgi:hypothetical protein